MNWMVSDSKIRSKDPQLSYFKVCKLILNTDTKSQYSSIVKWLVNSFSAKQQLQEPEKEEVQMHYR